jgi:endonuclease G, mitochondrial
MGFWLFENFYTPDTYSTEVDDHLKTKIPSYLMPNSTTGAIVSHNHFMLSYNESFEQAEWVAYMLKQGHLTHDDRKRPYFIEDPKVKSKSADWRNYKGSGFDRGHLCPAGDRRFSEFAYNETFYTSNVSPQNREFNAGVWNRLEIQIRKWVKRYGTLFIVTGGVLEQGLEEIGEEDVDVPMYYYKIVAKGDAENLEVIAFLMPNVESTEPLDQFVISIDKIEKMTGLDFFYKLMDSEQMQFENTPSASGWRF